MAPKQSEYISAALFAATSLLDTLKCARIYEWDWDVAAATTNIPNKAVVSKEFNERKVEIAEGIVDLEEAIVIVKLYEKVHRPFTRYAAGLIEVEVLQLESFIEALETDFYIPLMDKYDQASINETARIKQAFKGFHLLWKVIGRDEPTQLEDVVGGVIDVDYAFFKFDQKIASLMPLTAFEQANSTRWNWMNKTHGLWEGFNDILLIDKPKEAVFRLTLLLVFMNQEILCDIDKFPSLRELHETATRFIAQVGFINNSLKDICDAMKPEHYEMTFKEFILVIDKNKVYCTATIAAIEDAMRELERRFPEQARKNMEEGIALAIEADLEATRKKLKESKEEEK
jgi:hypothetical protein